MTLFRDKYRIESTRLPGWDYSAAGYYFVTFCTHGRIPCLSQVVDGDVLLSPIGEIVAEEWLMTQQIRPYVRLDEWIIMPNHVHGIIAITHPVETGRRPVFPSANQGDGTVRRPEETGHRQGEETGQRPVSTNIKPDSISAIIAQIKSISTKRIRRNVDPDFRWQERFYDRIIRNQEALVKARAYIVGNPAKWANDRENAPGVFM